MLLTTCPSRRAYHSIVHFAYGLMLLAAPAIEAAPPGPPPAPVIVTDAVEREMAPFAWFAGTIISRNDARLSAEADGRLLWVAEVGDIVTKGDVVVRIDDTLIRQDLSAQQAAVARERARLAYLNQEVKRLQKLVRQNSASQSTLDENISNQAVTRNELKAAQARVEQTQEHLNRSQIRAPFTGVITERSLQAGEWANSGDSVVRIVDTGSMEVQTRVPVDSLSFIKPGNVLNLKLANGRQGKAAVRTIVPVGDDQSRLYELRLTLVENGWLAGQTVQVAVPTAATRKVIAVPRDALVLRRDGARVFRIKDDNTADPVGVETGVAVGDYIEVQGGIKSGDRVVIRGGERLQPGQIVQPNSSLMAQ